MIRVLLAKRYDLIHLHVPNPFAVLLVLVLGRGARVSLRIMPTWLALA